MSDNVKKPDQSTFKEDAPVSLKVSDSDETGDILSAEASPIEKNAPPALEHVSLTSIEDGVNENPSPTPTHVASTPQMKDTEKRTTPSEVESPLASSSSRGMKRHRAIIGGSMLTSLILLGVSCLDLTHLISSRGVVDSKLKVTTVPKLPDLPFPMSYRGHYPSEKADLLPISELTLSGKKFGFADRQGKIVIPPQFSSVGIFSDGLAPFATENNNSQKWGFIDSKGSVTIPARYTSVGLFNGGLCAVEVDGAWRLIDKTGKFKSALKLQDRPYWTGRGFVVAETALRNGFLNLEGKYELPPVYSRISPLIDSPTDSRYNSEEYTEDDYRNGPSNYRAAKYFLIVKDGYFGVADGVGNIVLKPQFEEITSFSNGHGAVAVDRLLGFADSAGKIVVKPQFYSVTPFDELIAVKNTSSSKYQLIDSVGKSIEGKPFEDIVTDQGKWLSDGLAAFGDDDKYGYFDSRGRVAIPPIFEFARPFQNGFAVVKFNGVYRFIDKAGRFASPIEFASVTNLSSDGAKAVVAGPLYRFIENDSIKNSMRAQRANRGLTFKK